MLGVWWSRIRNRLYDENYLTASRPSAFVISVGNLTWGGTGKTTLVKQIAGKLISNGMSVAIVSRGYGRTSRGPFLISDGKQILADWKMAGEEAYWLARSLPSVPVVVGEDREAAVQKLNGLDPEIIVLDDGFQHRRIARDLDLVLIDASENLLKQNVIPFGKLREPVDSLRRADAILLTHSAVSNPNTTRWISENLHIPVFHANYQIADHALKGKRIAAFCAIGAPHHFFNLLSSLGATLVLQKAFRDHHVYTAQELKDLESETAKAGAELLVTTEKDSVKLDGFSFGLPLQTIRAKLALDESEQFDGFLLQRIRNRELKPVSAERT